MPVVTREHAIDVVRRYGLAWRQRSIDGITALFSKDALYVERVYDPAGVFKGQRGIAAYWKRQVIGKHRAGSIRFNQLEDDLVFDAERNVAMVKWEAQFDNFTDKKTGFRTVRSVPKV